MFERQEPQKDALVNRSNEGQLAQSQRAASLLAEGLKSLIGQVVSQVTDSTNSNMEAVNTTLCQLAGRLQEGSDQLSVQLTSIGAQMTRIETSLQQIAYSVEAIVKAAATAQPEAFTWTGRVQQMFLT
jgi:hypothetical protein